MSNDFSFDRRRNVIIRTQNQIVKNIQSFTQNDDNHTQLRDDNCIIEMFDDNDDDDEFAQNRVFVNNRNDFVQRNVSQFEFISFDIKKQFDDVNNHIMHERRVDEKYVYRMFELKLKINEIVQ